MSLKMNQRMSLRKMSLKTKIRMSLKTTGLKMSQRRSHLKLSKIKTKWHKKIQQLNR